MINFRVIFNPNYSSIGLLIIIALLLLIFIINKNISKSCHDIGKNLIIAGLFTLSLFLIINLASNKVIPVKFQPLIDVIRINLIKNIIMYSVISIIIGIIFLTIGIIFSKKNKF